MNTEMLDDVAQDAAHTKECLARMVRLFQRSPETGRTASTTTVRLGASLQCQVQDGNQTYRIAMPESTGGDGSAPDPGGFGRGALGSCLAIGLAMHAAQQGIDLRGVEVEVTAHYDVGGMLGTSSARPGYSLLDVTMRVESSASAEVLERLVAQMEAYSPWRDNLANPVEIRRTLVVEAPSLAAGEMTSIA